MFGDLDTRGTGESSFLEQLARLLRRQGEWGAWEGKDERETLSPLLVPARRRGGGGRDPDPDAFLRIELFYAAVAAAIEQRTGVACLTMMRMYGEGFGRVVVLAGRLVAVSRSVHDVHRFGFESVESLGAAGERAVAPGVAMIERFPELAGRGG